MRECCGGFGYLKVSGHPGFMERVSIRAAQPALTIIPENKEIIKRLHYYSSDEKVGLSYIKEISSQGNTIPDVFYYFLLICMKMKENKEKLGKKQYLS